ncbi:MAG: amino acid decarboxylase [Ruminococcaceae bacterium]|nr:amino acid decarboxylase [Oscillospiraceae bacterium]
MDTPICDFVRAYAQTDVQRLHMPGHKGIGPLGVEALDITEVEGADELYRSSGIIHQSQENAARLFGAARTLYSTEGSSLAIRAMVYLAALYAHAQGETPRIAAGRNAHKVFMTAAALLDVEVDWLFGEHWEGLASCSITGKGLENYLTRADEPPTAVYITSPDYLGNLADIRGLARVCRKFGVLLLVDNAHGAYLRFLPEDLHPMTLGADLCCDSGHKTLPVLTGGAYLHLSHSAPELIHEHAQTAMELFASTSPSYLILQSLDAVNAVLVDDYRLRLAEFVRAVEQTKERLTRAGYLLVGNESLKLTLAPRSRGYTGTQLAEYLAGQGLVCEFADPDYVVLMLAPENGLECLELVEQALINLPKQECELPHVPPMCRPEQGYSPHRALLCAGEERVVEECRGTVLVSPMVSCPPAIPIVVCGEVIDDAAIALMRYYGVGRCRVIEKEKV